MHNHPHRAAPSDWITNIAARRHIHRLRRQGHTHATIAAALTARCNAPIRPTTVAWIAQRRPLAIRPALLQHLLSVGPPRSYIPATTVRGHVLRLRAAGVPMRHIARLARRDVESITRIAAGTAHTVAPHTAAAILAITPAPGPGPKATPVAL